MGKRTSIFETLFGKTKQKKNETGTVTDIEGNVYNTVKIGDQWWMAENLNVGHYRNGIIIPEIRHYSYSDWASMKYGARCYIHDSRNSADKHLMSLKYGPGALYNWYAVNDNQNLAPNGWHVPSDDEWKILVDYLGGTFVAGGKMKATGFANWKNPNKGATNESGFTALPQGERLSVGTFDGIRCSALFWSTTETYNANAWQLNYNDAHVNHTNRDKHNGLSVRLIRD